jgi:hypothetical protein
MFIHVDVLVGVGDSGISIQQAMNCLADAILLAIKSIYRAGFGRCICQGISAYLRVCGR